MRLCVTGLQGQVVSALAACGPEQGVEVIRLGRPTLDLAQPDAVGEVLARLMPDVVVNAAAYTAVDQAESEPDIAMAVNGSGPGVLSAACATLNMPIIQLSTDFVFDGCKSTPYREDDPTEPLSVYGRSKLVGERAVADANIRHVILRTSWVYEALGRNFVRTMLHLAEGRPVLSVVADQFGCPTFATDIADAVLSIARQIKDVPEGDPRFGVFHLAGGGDTSWAGFAAAIFQFAERAERPYARVIPISTAQYPTPALRPANSRLDCTKLHDIYGLRLPHWHDGLARCLDRHFRALAG